MSVAWQSSPAATLIVSVRFSRTTIGAGVYVEVRLPPDALDDAQYYRATGTGRPFLSLAIALYSVKWTGVPALTS